MKLGKAAVVAVLVAAAVTVGGCDGPLMMSDEKTETTEKAKPDQGGAVKDPGSADHRME